MQNYFFTRQGKTSIKKTSREGSGINLVDKIKHPKKFNFQVEDISNQLEEDGGWISAAGEEEEEFADCCQTKPEKEKLGKSQIKASKSQIKANPTRSTSAKVLTQISFYEKSLTMNQVSWVSVFWMVELV